MSMLLVTILLMSPAQPGKQGGVPFIVVNPDTLAQQESGSGDLSGVQGDLASIISLEGGHFGVGVVDLESGETAARSEAGRFFIGLPNVATAACVIDLASTGEFPMDNLVARIETIEEVLRRAQQGGVDASNRPFHDIGADRIDSWLAQKGFTGTELHGVQLLWEGAPEVDPNYTTVEDCLGMLRVVYENMDTPSTRRITSNPELGAALESEIPPGTTVYGWTSTGDGHRDLTLILYMPDGRRYGMVVLADDLCCSEKADLAFSMLLDAVAD
jgi:hypothetical protein